ncbi:MAG TPA: M20 family metallopeptidase [Gemmatimonadales bacterium]|nr:M20 family metallopeptidase [Gemmatimonadales bacterium]
MKRDPVALARELLAFNTINPPGNESECARYLGRLLENAGFSTRTFDFAPGRTSLVATLPGNGSRPPICFTGHLDTVPLGATPWCHDPFAGEVAGDRLYGRGASDMKAAVAAMVVMAGRMAGLPRRSAGLTLVFTAGEETSCQGARHLANTPGALGPAGALVVGEPTGNTAVVAHKGCVRFAITTRGVTAHASMPEAGDNAIYKAADLVTRLRRLDFGVPSHPLLGAPTLNVGTIEGGMNINSVPDWTRIGVDIRLLPGQTENAIRRRLLEVCGGDVEIERLEGAGSVQTDPEHPWIREVLALAGGAPQGAPYFTDASVLTPALGDLPTVILGPGEAEQAHTTDEYCRVSRLEAATELYVRIAEAWCGAPG